MDRDWSRQELSDHWSLGFAELARIEAKSETSRLGYAAQLKFYQIAGRFPSEATEVPGAARDYLAEQLGRQGTELFDYDWSGRNGQRHRADILEFLGVCAFEMSDQDALRAWLEAEICPCDVGLDAAFEAIDQWCLSRKVQAPSKLASQRLMRSARRRFEETFLNRISAALAPETVVRMDASLGEAYTRTGFAAMKADPGRIALESLLTSADRLSFVRELDLPRGLLAGVGPSMIERLRRRVAQETAWEMRRHTPARRLGLYAIFLMMRQSEITDGLVDLLLETRREGGAQHAGGADARCRACLRQGAAFGRYRCGSDGKSRWYGAGCDLPGGRGSEAESDHGRIQGARRLGSTRPSYDAGLLRQSLPADAACAARGPGVSFQQRGASAGSECPGMHSPGAKTTPPAARCPRWRAG